MELNNTLKSKKLSKSIGDAVKVGNSFSKCNFQSGTNSDKKSSKRKSSFDDNKSRKKKKKLANLDLDYGDLLKLYAAKQRKSTPIREIFQESTFCSSKAALEINKEASVKKDNIDGKKAFKRKKAKKYGKTANLSGHLKPSNRLSDIVDKLHKFNATYLSDSVVDVDNKDNYSFFGNTEVLDNTGGSNECNFMDNETDSIVASSHLCMLDQNGKDKTSTVADDDVNVRDTYNHPSVVTTDENCFINLNKKDIDGCEATKENPLKCQLNILSNEVDKSVLKSDDCAEKDLTSGETSKKVLLSETSDFTKEFEKSYGSIAIVENIESETKPTKKQLITSLLNYG